jgi:phage-related minor tail protein
MSLFNFSKTASFGAIVIAVLIFPVFASAAAITATGNGPNAIWAGSTSSYEFNDLCSFTGNDDGTMVLTGNVWNVVTPAVVTLKTRGVDQVTVVSDEKIRIVGSGVAVDDVTVS